MQRALITPCLITLLSFSACAQDVATPPNSDEAEAALGDSTRHQEYVKLPLPSGGEVNTFVVYPERSDKAPVVIVIHEIFGMTDWVNSVADHLAKQGFIALAPDMITGMEGNAMGLVRALTKEQIVERLNAVRDYALEIPAATGKIGVTGFCWGGSATWIYATAQPGIDAAVPFYGSAPDASELENIEAPILAHYGENDARVNVTIEPAQEKLDELGKSFEPHVYPGAGHGFLRAQTANEGNQNAADEAWDRTIAFFKEHLKTE